jgi:hypothetical protein
MLSLAASFGVPSLLMPEMKLYVIRFSRTR